MHRLPVDLVYPASASPGDGGYRALTAGTAVVLFHVLGGGGEAYLQSLVAEAFTLAGSLALGLWITREGRLSEERRHLVEELTATQHQLVGLHRAAGVAAERQRWSREVHDTIAQSLTSVVMQTERARRSYAADQTASLAGQLGLLEDSARELCSRPAPWWPPAHHPA